MTKTKAIDIIGAPSTFGQRKLGSEIPCRVSSDPHERRNDLGTVSTRDSVKS
ncbi:Arginase [Staphylococcus aureus]|nr:Arginase [Staphylococcus aureus]